MQPNWTPVASVRQNPSARQRIIDAAAGLFYTRGVRGTGVDRIIADASVAKATFYNHFKSKDELIIAWLESPQTKWFDSAVADVEATSPHGVARLLGFFEWVERWTQSEGFHGCPYANTAVEMSFAGPQTRAVDDEQRRIEATLARWAGEAGVEDAEALAAELMLLLPGLFVLALVRKAVEPATAARRAVAVLLRARGLDA